MNNNHYYQIEPASFRDRSGFIFSHKGAIYRQVNLQYKKNYDFLFKSGLYKRLVDEGLILPHQEIDDITPPKPDVAYKIIQPERIDFISYPYEWCYLQYRSAAITTIRIAKTALDFGIVLKDASAYNMQFHKGRWRMIDTLSFEIFQEGKPWIAYKQFCQHFLAPLALMSQFDQRLGLINRLFIDGVPLDMAASLLPLRAYINTGLSVHIFLHARSQNKYAKEKNHRDQFNGRFNKKNMKNLLESLRATVKKMNVRLDKTEWANYYADTNYSEKAFLEKKDIVEGYIDDIAPDVVWDIGANTGEFSRIASSKGILTIAFDFDPGAVSRNYLHVRKNNDIKLMPLVMDLTNPSPSLGWGHEERKSLHRRGPADMIIALAVIHHLAISNNIPLDRIAKYFCQIGKFLIIEFVPKSDSQVQLLLKSREDIFSGYSILKFESVFENYFKILQKRTIIDSDRIIYLMQAS